MDARHKLFVIRRRWPIKPHTKETAKGKRNKVFYKLRDNAERHNFKYLGLQGLREACDSESSIYKRMLWGILWLSMVCCSITQCTICLRVYFDSPTSTNVEYTKPKTITPPCITFCPYDYYDRIPSVWKPLLEKYNGTLVSYNNTYHLLQLTNMTISTLWNMSRFVFENLVHDVWKSGFNGDSKNTFAMEHAELNTVEGICLLFKPMIQLPCYGNHAEVHVAAAGELLDPTYRDTEYTVIFHSEAEIPLLRYYGPLVDGTFLPYDKVATMALRLQEERHVNSWKKPCTSEKYYFQCKADCFESIIRSESNLTNLCRLPFMKEDANVPLCTTADELKDIYLATRTAKEKMHDAESHCKCYTACTKTVYTTELMHFAYGNGTENVFEIYVIFPKCQIQIIHEVFTYWTSNLMSDVGGTLGLCMGMSILSIVAILEVLLLKIRSLITALF